MLAPEPEIYPYTATQAIPARSLLVFAPHPDDEVFGCGGSLALALDAGSAVHVVVVSDGAKGGEPMLRERESRAAASALAAGAAAPHIEFWHEPDRAVALTERLAMQMRSAIAASGADWIFAPSPFEIHPDHRSVCLAACAAFGRSFGPQSTARLAFYEVGHPLLPNLLVDITPVLARKAAAMACFASQLALQRYDEHVLALNRYRSYTLGPVVSHAEAFHVLGAGELAGGAGVIVDSLGAAVKRRLGVLG